MVTTPIAIKIGLQKWLSEQTQRNVTIAEVNLNIFSGKLFLRQLHIPHQNKAERPSSLEYASITIDMSALFQQKIVVNEITLSHANIVIDQTTDQLHIAGIPIPQNTDSTAEPVTATSDNKPVEIAIHSIKLDTITLQYRSDDINSDIEINSKIKNIKTAMPNEAMLVALNLGIDKGEIRYQGELHPFLAAPTIDGKLAINHLDLATLATLAPQNNFIINQLTLNHQSDIKGVFPLDRTPQIKLSGDTTLRLGANKGEVHYQGVLDTFLAAPTIDGKLTINHLDLANLATLAPQDDFIINQLTLNHQSDIKGAFPMDGTPQIKLMGDSTLNNIDIVTTLNNDTYLKTASIAINKIDVEYPSAISIGEVIISGLDTALLKDSDGNLLIKETPASDATAAATSSATPPTEQGPVPTFSIGSLSIEGDSALAFSDASVAPQFNIKLQPLSLTLGSINTANPNAETALSLAANINETGTTKLTGHLSPLADELTLTLNNTLTKLELPVLSPYTEQAIGYQLRRGRLSAETALEIKGDKLQVSNKLTLAKLSIKESDPEKAQGLIEQLEMPLDSALDLLRDGDDNIVFDLPVNGSLSDPQFKLGGVVKLAIGKGMKMAAMKYLTNALQPLGTLLLAKDIVGVITKPRFKPLSFEAGKSELDKETYAYLDKIGDLLTSRPQLSIALCGIANNDDQFTLSATPAPKQKEAPEAAPAQSINEQLYALATARADNARSHLNQQGVDNHQLFECNPEISPENGDSDSIVEGVDISL